MTSLDDAVSPHILTHLCAACGESITAQFARTLGATFHPGCLRCHECNTMITGKLFPVDGPDNTQHVLCERDYLMRLNLMCAKCEGALNGSYITAGDKKYHPEHFTCSICPTRLESQDSYYEHDGSLFCHWHYSTRLATKCSGCDSAVLKEFIHGEGGMFHLECYLMHKFWDIKLAAPLTRIRKIDATLEKRLSHETEERLTTPEFLKAAQSTTAARVHAIYTTLNAFDESIAMIVGGIFSSNDYHVIIHGAQKLTIQIGKLFIAAETIMVKDDSQTECARALYRKTVDLLSLASSGRLPISLESTVAQRLLQEFTHELKRFLKIGLINAIGADESGHLLERFLAQINPNSSENIEFGQHRSSMPRDLCEKHVDSEMNDTSGMGYHARLLGITFDRFSWLMNNRSAERLQHSAIAKQSLCLPGLASVPPSAQYDIESLTTRRAQWIMFQPLSPTRILCALGLAVYLLWQLSRLDLDFQFAYRFGLPVVFSLMT